jgi:putative tryptophan/tyrosine transport system substrate-binding protein
MNRREFIAGLAGAAAWPVVTRAQKQKPLPVIGFLSSRSLDDSTQLVTAFGQGLAEVGFVEHQNVVIEFRWAMGQYDRLPALAADLVARQVAVIVTNSTPGVIAAKAATSSIPVVFLVGADPIQYGLVSSLNRPGGNVTGVSILSNTLAPKQLEVLHELVPAAGSIAFLINPNNPVSDSDVATLQAAASAIGQQIFVVQAGTESGIDQAFTILVQQHAGAVVVETDSFFNSRIDQLATLAVRYGKPAIADRREFVAAGGLVSYGPRVEDAFRQVGVYTGLILKGTRPADLPVVQPTKFELVINRKVANALGLYIPSILLARADEVIE